MEDNLVIDKAKRLHIMRQVLAKNQARGSHGKFVKAGYQNNGEQGTRNNEQGAVNNELGSRNQELGIEEKTKADSQVFSYSEDKSKAGLSSDDPPLVNLKVTNPITYFKNWWKKVIGDEGIEMKWSLKVKPLTALLLLAFIFSGGITISLINKVKDKTPVANYIPAFSSELPVQRGFNGTIEVTGKNEYFLITSDEVITLTASGNINLQNFLSKKVLVSGKYTNSSKTLLVEDIKEIAIP